jgi:hypothetical protein
VYLVVLLASKKLGIIPFHFDIDTFRQAGEQRGQGRQGGQGRGRRTRSRGKNSILCPMPHYASRTPVTTLPCGNAFSEREAALPCVYNAGNPQERTGSSSRETLSAVPPGGNHASCSTWGDPKNALAPQDRTASPRRWLSYSPVLSRFIVGFQIQQMDIRFY